MFFTFFFCEGVGGGGVGVGGANKVHYGEWGSGVLANVPAI